MTYTAVIPVRAGSRRLPGKNIAPFAGVNLLTYKIRQLQRVELISSIVVSSDSDEMLDMGMREGALTHKREPKYCDEKTVPFGGVVRHICESIVGDNVVWATCTAPLVNEKMYLDAIFAYEKGLAEGYDSLMSVEAFKRYIWNDKGPLNYELGLKHVPSQELEQLYYVTDGILIAPRLKMIEWAYFHGVNPLKYPLPRKASVDIDDKWDLAIARCFLDME
jgi:CMP-N-acetylneuraminic acid synthetase